ncbi:uncharacterized protein LOC131674804 [Phymastichus coffea]|uniref:uncharacterized protein LOC131670303 n=1 Tax=Phymastichus coffea TaxID=108790 RepID=UPI00273C5799|nr:uncharacterized protein LOC131670303 [Phymastichus coffea]XP_058809617.1 uncharacterized protein LOC131674804 [Phymastichus coffea]
MEFDCDGKESTITDDVLIKKHENLFVKISSSWEINNGKILEDSVSTVSVLQASEKINLEDVVSLDTCVALKADPSGESCKVDFQVTNKQKIARIAVVSEASVLELFKQSGEYANTIFAEFVDEFQDHAVYIAESIIQPPSTEASIKFTRTKNKDTMWIYGIRLTLTEPLSENSKNHFDFDVINNYLSNTPRIRPERIEMAKKVLESFTSGDSNSSGDDINTRFQSWGMAGWSSNSSNRIQGNNRSSNTSEVDKRSECNGTSITVNSELKKYIDEQFTNMEKRLMAKIESMNRIINQKLDILLKLES